MPPAARQTGLFGLTDGSFFKAPPHIDLSVPPGAASLKNYYIRDNPWIWNIVTLKFFFFAPHFFWFLITVLVYFIFPYDLEAAKEWSLGWVIRRTLLHVAIVLSYFGFWYITLFQLGWARRKFKPDNCPTAGRMFHNVYYTSLGAVQMGMFEAVFMHMWARGKLPYISDAEMLGSPAALCWSALLVLAIPVFRDFHFYFAHRFLHLRFFYKYVHALHHRNSDIEPFSGMCMHPVEHLYYFTSLLPSIYLLCSPLHFLWGALHLTLAPAASHSGWEDHWQSDLFHYLHHAKFECNYGTMGIPLDHWFGTFRDRLNPVDRKHSQQQTEQKARPWSLAAILATPANFVYACIVSAIFALFGLAAVRPSAFAPTFLGTPTWAVVSATLAVGPIAAAFLLWLASREKFAVFWPFHNERLVGAFGFHTLAGSLMTLMPVYHIASSLLSPTSTYCNLWGC
eukprot:g16727.t1